MGARLVLALGAATRRAAAASDCLGPLTAGLHEVKCDRFHLSYNVPSQCTASQQCGLVVDVHGLSMNAQIQDNNTNMRALGEREGYIILQPSQGLGVSPLTSWDDTGKRDDPAVDAALWEAVAKFGPSGLGVLDLRRVHFMGFQGSASVKALSDVEVWGWTDAANIDEAED